MRDRLLSGIYDLALSTSDIRTTGLEPVLVDQGWSVCVMHKQHPLPDKASVHVRDLQNYPLLVHHSDDAQHQLLQQVMLKHDVTPPSILETNYSATICTLAAHGVGIGIVSTYAASIFANLVHAVLFHPRIVVQTHMAYSSHVAPSKLAVDFDCPTVGAFQDDERLSAGIPNQHGGLGNCHWSVAMLTSMLE